MSIKFYKTRDPFGFMSNYSRHRFYVYDRWWDCVEAPYQAMKTFDRSEQDEIQKARTSNEARLLGQKVTFRSDWDQVKDSVMKECLRAKFLQHKDIRDQLMGTGNQELIEDSPVDYYWGCGRDGTGKNKLGKLLMEIREELKDGELPNVVTKEEYFANPGAVMQMSKDLGSVKVIDETGRVRVVIDHGSNMPPLDIED